PAVENITISVNVFPIHVFISMTTVLKAPGMVCMMRTFRTCELSRYCENHGAGVFCRRTFSITKESLWVVLVPMMLMHPPVANGATAPSHRSRMVIREHTPAN